jgi:hypothetical protein
MGQQAQYQQQQHQQQAYNARNGHGGYDQHGYDDGYGNGGGKTGIASVEKMTVKQCISMITLRLAACEEFAKKLIAGEVNIGATAYALATNADGESNGVMIDREMFQTLLGRIDSVEKKAAAAAAAPPPSSSGGGSALEIAALKKQVEALRGRIDPLTKDCQLNGSQLGGMKREIADLHDSVNCLNSMVATHDQKLMWVDADGKFTGVAPGVSFADPAENIQQLASLPPDPDALKYDPNTFYPPSETLLAGDVQEEPMPTPSAELTAAAAAMAAEAAANIPRLPPIPVAPAHFMQQHQMPMMQPPHTGGYNSAYTTIDF